MDIVANTLIFFLLICTIGTTITTHAQDTSLQSILEKAGYDEVDWEIHDPSQIITVNTGNQAKQFIAVTGKAQEDGYDCGIETWYREIHGGGDWRPGQCLFRTKPSWVKNELSGNDGAFWAPELINSSTLLYSVSDYDDYYGTTCVGLATATTSGSSSSDITQLTWVDSGSPITCIYANDYEEERSAIDPTVFTGFNGKTYLVTGGGVIHGTEINPLTYRPMSGNYFSTADSSWKELARGKWKPIAEEYDWVEAAYVWPIESDGQQYYFLFVNWGACCSGKRSTYNIRIGRSTSPLGPFVDKSGTDLMDGGGTLLLKTDDFVIGPGHVGIHDDSIMSFHYYDRTRPSGLSWVGERKISVVNGWPVLGELISYWGSGGTTPNDDDTIPTTEAPTSSSPSTCYDSTLRFKLELARGRVITRSCVWVQNKSKRCALDGVSSMCPNTCGTCSSCMDGENRFKIEINGEKRSRNCTWVANKQTSYRCSMDGVSDTCRDTCGQC